MGTENAVTASYAVATLTQTLFVTPTVMNSKRGKYTLSTLSSMTAGGVILEEFLMSTGQTAPLANRAQV